MCNLCLPMPFQPCDICCARRDAKTQDRFDDGRLNQEQYDCMMSDHYVNEHEQQHSKMLNVCVDKEMLKLVEHVNDLGIYTSFSCLEQRMRDSTPGIVVKCRTVEEVSCIIKDLDPDLHSAIEYFEWNGIHPITKEPDIRYTDVTLYFPGGIPADFRS